MYTCTRSNCDEGYKGGGQPCLGVLGLHVEAPTKLFPPVEMTGNSKPGLFFGRIDAPAPEAAPSCVVR